VQEGQKSTGFVRNPVAAAVSAFAHLKVPMSFIGTAQHAGRGAGEKQVNRPSAEYNQAKPPRGRQGRGE
jgi:hypothetical protein